MTKQELQEKYGKKQSSEPVSNDRFVEECDKTTLKKIVPQLKKYTELTRRWWEAWRKEVLKEEHESIELLDWNLECYFNILRQYIKIRGHECMYGFYKEK
jgi:hypothetical protein